MICGFAPFPIFRTCNFSSETQSLFHYSHIQKPVNCAKSPDHIPDLDFVPCEFKAIRVMAFSSPLLAYIHGPWPETHSSLEHGRLNSITLPQTQHEIPNYPRVCAPKPSKMFWDLPKAQLLLEDLPRCSISLPSLSSPHRRHAIGLSGRHRCDSEAYTKPPNALSLEILRL